MRPAWPHQSADRPVLDGELLFFQQAAERIERLRPPGLAVLVGKLLGAFIVAVSGGEFTAAWESALRESRFGPDIVRRKTTRPEPDLLRLYEALGLAHQSGGVQKLIA